MTYFFEADDASGSAFSAPRDDLTDKAWDIIRTTKNTFISNLRLKLGIGYNRATKIVDILEERGKVGPLCFIPYSVHFYVRHRTNFTKKLSVHFMMRQCGSC